VLHYLERRAKPIIVIYVIICYYGSIKNMHSEITILLVNPSQIMFNAVAH